jgi:UTP-glucose-1-phosphate uridylyltransferase
MGTETQQQSKELLPGLSRRLAGDVLLRLSKQESIYGCQFEGIRYDCGDQMGFLSATFDLALKREDFNGSQEISA